MSSVVVEESIARVNARRKIRREKRSKRHSRIFWTEFCLGFITGTLNAKQRAPKMDERKRDSKEKDAFD